MIVCHPLKLIFVKTKKVGGTSFEIALSSFCGPDCVVTPISQEDEVIRSRLGYRGPQNFDRPSWPDGSQSDTGFYNHMPADEARRHIPDEIWRTYRKVTIRRDPFDAAISRYHWEGGPQNGLSFGDFVAKNRHLLRENLAIAPLTGPAAPDTDLRYEALEEDVRALGVPDLWERFSQLRVKGDLRPGRGQGKAEVYRRHPEAARIVSEACAEEIRHFGYPPPPPPVERVPMRDRPQYFFTLTAGRTGTAWLARFLAQNLGIEAVHEPLAIEDFGTRMPEIRTMRSFNDLGFDDHVRAFWQGKLDALPRYPHAETNHTLGKCGLVEALAESDLAEQVKVIVLTRDLAAQCASYVRRNDFVNITIVWQWYLSWGYRNVMLDPAPFRRLGHVGHALWYTCEMAARQRYYVRLFADRLNFVHAKLEDVTTTAGAGELLEGLGASCAAPVLPSAVNTAPGEGKERLEAQVRDALARTAFDPDALAARFIARGGRLHGPSSTEMRAAS